MFYLPYSVFLHWHPYLEVQWQLNCDPKGMPTSELWIHPVQNNIIKQPYIAQYNHVHIYTTIHVLLDHLPHKYIRYTSEISTIIIIVNTYYAE